MISHHFRDVRNYLLVWPTFCSFSKVTFKYKLDQLFSYMLHIIHKNIPGFKVSFDIGKRVLDKGYLFWWENLGVKYIILIILHLALPSLFLL